MSNLTISTDPVVLKKARLRVLREGTSVNAVLRAFMAGDAGLVMNCMNANERNFFRHQRIGIHV